MCQIVFFWIPGFDPIFLGKVTVQFMTPRRKKALNPRGSLLIGIYIWHLLNQLENESYVIV